MSEDTGNGDTTPLAMLLQRVERDREQRCRELLEAARAEAEAMRAEAHGQARRRVGQVIADERRRVAERLNSARAEQETRQRQQRHQRMNAALAHAWELLEAALERRWQSAEGRRAWIAGALAQAEHFLPPGTWTIHHPPELSRSELPDALDRTGDPGPGQVTLTSEADSGLAAGVRIRCGGAELDATAAGLLVDSERIRSWLLAAIEEHRQGGDAG